MLKTQVSCWLHWESNLGLWRIISGTFPAHQIPSKDKHIYQCPSFSCWNGVNPRAKKKKISIFLRLSSHTMLSAPSPTYFTIYLSVFRSSRLSDLPNCEFSKSISRVICMVLHHCYDKMFIWTAFPHISKLEMGFLCYCFSSGSPCRCIVVGR